jgi:hypothetical protein
MIAHVEVLVEEASMEVALRKLIPRLIPDLSFKIYASMGKHGMLKRLPDRLRGYATFLPADWRVLVIVDRDDEDCRALKLKLDEVARNAGLVTKTEGERRSISYAVINRIAVEELEAWFFGNWAAVHTAYPRVPPTIPAQAKYRLPDSITGGTWEALQRVLQRAGYFAGGLRKIEFAETVTEHMHPDLNTSPSFNALVSAIRGLREDD